MKKLFKGLEDLFVAVTFAEVGEFETAAQIMKEEEGLKAESYKVKAKDEKKPNLATQPANIK